MESSSLQKSMFTGSSRLLSTFDCRSTLKIWERAYDNDGESSNRLSKISIKLLTFYDLAWIPDIKGCLGSGMPSSKYHV